MSKPAGVVFSLVGNVFIHLGALSSNLREEKRKNCFDLFQLEKLPIVLAVNLIMYC